MRKITIFAIVVMLSTQMFCIQKTVEPNEILYKVKEKIFDMNVRTESCSLKSIGCNVSYFFKLDVIRGKTVVRFEGLDDDCENIIYDRLKSSLEGAVLIDDRDFYYLYMPKVSSYVVKYKPQDSIVRYRGLPIVTISSIVDTFDKARDLRYVGKEKVKVNGRYVESDVIEYNFNDQFLGKIDIKVYIYDDIPIKAVLYVPEYNAKILVEVMEYEFGKAKDFDLSKYEILERI